MIYNTEYTRRATETVDRTEDSFRADEKTNSSLGRPAW